jgi:hypothetical protein
MGGEFVNAPAETAACAITEIMATGSQKDRRDQSWREKSQFFHLTKAIRHTEQFRRVLCFFHAAG